MNLNTFGVRFRVKIANMLSLFIGWSVKFFELLVKLCAGVAGDQRVHRSETSDCSVFYMALVVAAEMYLKIWDCVAL